VDIWLPIPPPANNLFINVPGRGRAPSRRYVEWQREALAMVARQAPARIDADAIAFVALMPMGVRADFDNLFKALQDVIVKADVIENDRRLRPIAMLPWRGMPDHVCRVLMAPVPPSDAPARRGRRPKVPVAGVVAAGTEAA
jgi:Holliday junction resolvase RusA-like endonuclease